MEKEQLSQQQSIDLIMNMVNQSKYNIAQDKVIYLMWGYSVALSSLIHYGLQFIMDVPANQAWYIWLLMPVLGIINSIYFSRKKKDQNAKTFTDRALGAVWISFIAALITFIAASPAVGWQTIYPIFMVLYGIGSACSGGILKFKPLIYGGALSMFLGLISFYQVFEVQLLLLPLAITISFVVPAHMLPKNKTV